MRIISRSPGFKRELKKFIKNNPRLYERIEETLEEMLKDPFAPFLETHKLGGKFKGILSCSCGYDCRILFIIEQDSQTGNETVLLLSIGTHDAVY